MKSIYCPNCYGGHFRPCQWCGDTGRIEIEENDHIPKTGVEKTGSDIDAFLSKHPTAEFRDNE